MAKKSIVTIKGIPQAQKNAIKFLDSQTKNAELLNTLGKNITFEIAMRTRARLEEYKQDPLKESTIISRELLAEVNETNKFTIPKRSHLTFSGQLLDSIRHKIDTTSANITLFLVNTRKKYKQITKESISRAASKKSKSKRGAYYALGNVILQEKQTEKSNTQIMNDLESQGRKFLFMSVKVKAQLEKNITRHIRKQLQLFNRIRRKLSL